MVIAGLLACGGAAAQLAPAPSRAPSVQAPTAAAAASALLERGRAAWRAGDRYAALAVIAQARRLQPDNPEIAQALADVLMELGAPSAAAQALGARAVLGVRSRVAGQRLRWATDIAPLSPDPRRRFDDVDPALARLDSLLGEARAAAPPDAGLITRLQRDRAVAVRQRERWQDALDQVAALRAAGDEIPVYVLAAEAASEAERFSVAGIGAFAADARGNFIGAWRHFAADARDWR